MVNEAKGDPVAYVLPHDLQRMRGLAVGNIQYNLPLYPKPVDGAVALHAGPVGDPAMPVVAWRYTETGPGAAPHPKFYETSHASEHACKTFNGQAEPLVRQSDVLAAIAAVRERLRVTEELAGQYLVQRDDARDALEKPIDMVLYCPACLEQHIDEPERSLGPGNTERLDWDNPPHRSHLCHHCGHQWRPADVPTNGVLRTKTHGKNDMVLIDGPAHELRLLRAARITLNEEKKA